MRQGQMIGVGAIENTGPNMLVSFLRNASTGATEIDIGVAFITLAGLDSLLYFLKRTAGSGTVRILTGLYQGFTEPKALRALLKAQRASQSRLTVRMSLDSHFHWKAYFVVGRRSAKVVIGSSNLTDDGLRQSGELNSVLSLRKDSKEFSTLHSVFLRHWNKRSRPLTEEVVDKYEAWRIATEVSVDHRSVPVRMILGGERKVGPDEKRERLFWRTCINGYLSDETKSLLQETTDWDRRAFGYISTWQSSFNIGDQLVLFDLKERSISIVEVKDTTRTPQRTPDGYEFAAYRRVKGIPGRKLVPNRWRSLKARGLIRTKANVNTTRNLSPRRFETFVENMKSSSKSV